MTGSTAHLDTGAHGEHLAADYLQRAGYVIVAANWRCVQGELDLVARQGERLVFVEVRTRRAATTEAAFASITPAKRERFMAAVYAYLAAHAAPETDWRVDVIAVALRGAGPPLLEHLEDALDW